MKIKFEPRDIWIGLYWTPEYEGWKCYVCIIPCLPIIFTVRRRSFYFCLLGLHKWNFRGLTNHWSQSVREEERQCDRCGKKKFRYVKFKYEEKEDVYRK